MTNSVLDRGKTELFIYSLHTARSRPCTFFSQVQLVSPNYKWSLETYSSLYCIIIVKLGLVSCECLVPNHFCEFESKYVGKKSCLQNGGHVVWATVSVLMASSSLTLHAVMSPAVLVMQISSWYCEQCWSVNTLRPRQNGRHFRDDIFQRIFFKENCSILMKISLKFVAQSPINNIATLV